MHLKLRLRQEFPENFGEVFTSGTLNYNFQSYTYGPKSAYLAAIKPFRHAVVYPRMLRELGERWRASSAGDRPRAR